MKDLTYCASLVDTHLFDFSKEDPSKRKVFKAYFLEDMVAGPLWKDGEIATVTGLLRNSKLLTDGYAGTVVSFADLAGGYSKVFYYKLKRPHLVNGPLVVRNITVEPAINYLDKDAIDVAVGWKKKPDVQRVPEMTCRAENIIQAFDQGLLCEGGLLEFRDRWIDEVQTVFPAKKPPEL